MEHFKLNALAKSGATKSPAFPSFSLPMHFFVYALLNNAFCLSILTDVNSQSEALNVLLYFNLNLLLLYAIPEITFTPSFPTPHSRLFKKCCAKIKIEIAK